MRAVLVVDVVFGTAEPAEGEDACANAGGEDRNSNVLHDHTFLSDPTQKRPTAPRPAPVPNDTGATATDGFVFAVRVSLTDVVSGMNSELTAMRTPTPCTTPLVMIIALLMSS